jgi:hypothetical protein
VSTNIPLWKTALQRKLRFEIREFRSLEFQINRSCGSRRRRSEPLIPRNRSRLSIRKNLQDREIDDHLAFQGQKVLNLYEIEGGLESRVGVRSSPKVTSKEGPREKALTPTLRFCRKQKGRSRVS